VKTASIHRKEKSMPPSLERVLIVVGDASETVDTLYPFYRLQEAGFVPVVAGPERRTFQMVMHEVRPGWTITKEWEGYQITADIAFADVDTDDYLGIFFSGGRAPEYIRDNHDLVRITRQFFAAGKPIASVCHGVEIPAYADCVRGRRMATVAKCRFDLEVAGRDRSLMIARARAGWAAYAIDLRGYGATARDASAVPRDCPRRRSTPRRARRTSRRSRPRPRLHD
jgi:protease I